MSEFDAFIKDADAAAARTAALIERLRGLRELQRGRLTRSKRDGLTACRQSLTQLAGALEHLTHTDTQTRPSGKSLPDETPSPPRCLERYGNPKTGGAS